MASTYYYLTEEEKNSIGRLGGNAPEWFDDKRDMVDEPGCHYGFYCTLQLKDAGRSLSIFIPENFDRLLDDNIYPSCSIKAFAHPTTGESGGNYFTLMPEKPLRREADGPSEKVRLFPPRAEKGFYRAMCGKAGRRRRVPHHRRRHFLRSGRKTYYREALIKDGYEIWGYINEEGYYPLARETELIHGNMPFSRSALCICTKKAAR